MAVGTQESEDIITGINVTPLVDVVLVLLVMFMITAPVLYQSAIKVDLPKAASGEQTEHVTLRLTLMKDGTALLDRQKIELKDITDIAKRAVDKDPLADAVVGADSSLTHGAVMSFVDSLRTNGIKKIAIGVESTTAPGTQNGSKK
jgi:biopolymer transport protein ExbD